MFLNAAANNLSPIITPSIDNPLVVPFFQPGLTVSSYGYVSLTAQAVSGNPIIAPYYVLFKLPNYLPVQDGQTGTAFSSCPTTNF